MVSEGMHSWEGRPGHDVLMESRKALGDQTEMLDPCEREMIQEEKRVWRSSLSNPLSVLP